MALSRLQSSPKQSVMQKEVLRVVAYYFHTPVPEKISAHVHVSCQTGLARPDSIMNLNRQPISEQHRALSGLLMTSELWFGLD